MWIYLCIKKIKMEYNYVISGIIGLSYDWWTGQKGTTAKEVRDFLVANKDKELHIAVSSPGGHVDAGLEIYQLIRDHGNVHMHIIGMTASAATFLCMGAKSVDMVDGSLMLIHNASTSVMEWKSANKQQLDELISKFQKERDDLNTVDEVIASLYARKCKKSLQECLGKMDKAAWLSPKDALDFGLIDAIRDDVVGTQMSNSIRKYCNSITKDFGLPSMPSCSGDDAPVRSGLQKAVQWIFGQAPNKPAQKDEMKIKTLTCLAALLAVDGFLTNDDDSVAMSQEQLKKIDDRLSFLENSIKNADQEKKDLQSKLDNALTGQKTVQSELDKANEIINNLKAAPAAGTNQRPAGEEALDEEDKFLAESRESYNRIKDL